MKRDRVWLKAINGLIILAMALNVPVFSQDAKTRANFSITLAEKDTKQYKIVDVRDFGAKGNGTFDDTKSIQKAVDKAKPGSWISFPEGDYLITAPVIIRKSDICLVGNNARILFKPSSVKDFKVAGVKNGKTSGFTVSPAAFMVMGELETKRGFDAEKINAGDTSVAVRNDPGLLKKGELIVITGKDFGKKIIRKKGALSFFREQNFITLIEGKSAGSITVSDAVSIPFDSARVFRMKPARNVQIRGFEIMVGPSSRLLSGVFLAYARDCIVREITVRNSSKSGISLFMSYRCGAIGNTVRDSVKFGSDEGLGISLERSHFCVIRNNALSNHRHGILLDHGNGNCLVEGNTVDRAKTSASIDLHGEYNYFNTIRDNTVLNGKTGIIVGGGGDVHYNDGPNNAFVGNRIENCNIGIEIANESLPVIVGKNKFNAVTKKEILLSNVDKDGIVNLQ